MLYLHYFATVPNTRGHQDLFCYAELMTKRDTIEKYVQGWVLGNKNMVLGALTDDCTVRESHGPVYKGKNTVSAWFDEWNKEGKVLGWKLTSFLENENVAVFEWDFTCEVGDKQHHLLGITIVNFGEGKIQNLRKYRLTTEPFIWQK